MLAICERTSIEIALENGSKFPVYAVARLFSNIDDTRILETVVL